MSEVAEDERSLWDAFRLNPSIDTRNALVERYLGLVHHVAQRVLRQIGGDAEAMDDLVSVGTFGLIQAVAGFDPTRGNQFSTFGVRRIQGAMLDDLRAKDWAPRSHRAMGRTIKAAERVILANGKRPTPEEVARETDLPVADIDRYYSIEARGQTQSLDDPGAHGKETASVASQGDLTALDRVLVHEEASLIQSVISHLPARERTVILLHYYENLTLRQIAALLYVHETRVSQLHTSAKKRLRTLLGTDPSD